MSSNLPTATDTGVAVPDPVTDAAPDSLDPREAADLAQDMVELTRSLFALVLPPYDVDLGPRSSTGPGSSTPPPAPAAVDEPRPPSAAGPPPASVPVPASVPLPPLPPESSAPQPGSPNRGPAPRGPEPIPLPDLPGDLPRDVPGDLLADDPVQQVRPGSTGRLSMLDEISFLDD